MRSALVSFSAVALPLALLSGAVGLACSDSSVTSMSLGRGEASDAPTAGAGGSTSFNTSDAASADHAPPSGSPLCGVTPGRCLPDDDGQTTLAFGAAMCVERVDGGATADAEMEKAEPDTDTEAPTTTRACRIVHDDEGSFAPTCTSGSADWSGVDGVSCSDAADCAPGFDCAFGAQGSVCRRYCCAGSCAGQSSRNGGPTFCDVQTLMRPSGDGVKAPVCMPVKTCKLLRDGECSALETCAVINEKGDTGCVALGDAKAGASCDAEHCAAGLTCLGSPGDRRCYELCKVDDATCGPSQTCTTGSVFQDTTFGVCKDD